jgi:hypothetical protein
MSYLLSSRIYLQVDSAKNEPRQRIPSVTRLLIQTKEVVIARRVAKPGSSPSAPGEDGCTEPWPAEVRSDAIYECLDSPLRLLKA